MSPQEALERLVADARDAEAARVLNTFVHQVAAHEARAQGHDEATGEQEAQELLLHVITAAHAGTLRVKSAEKWARTALRNRLTSVHRAKKRVAQDPDVLDQVPVDMTPASNPVARMHSAYTLASEARREFDRPSLELAWKRYWRTVEESRTLESVVREEDPRANVGSAQRAHARMAEAVCANADPDDRALFEKLLSLRVLSGGSGNARRGDGEP
ncbi:MAG: hypothetical protein ACK4YP_18165 [Myxococcota bacterium]